jgi:hypothetical protein
MNSLQSVFDLSYVLSLVFRFPHISFELSYSLRQIISCDIVDIVHLELEVHLSLDPGIYFKYHKSQLLIQPVDYVPQQLPLQLIVL